MLNLLKGRIIQVYGGVKPFAAAVGMHYNTVYWKLSGTMPFTAKNVATWGRALNIPKEEYKDYFPAFYADLEEKGVV